MRKSARQQQQEGEGGSAVPTGRTRLTRVSDRGFNEGLIITHSLPDPFESLPPRPSPLANLFAVRRSWPSGNGLRKGGPSPWDLSTLPRYAHTERTGQLRTHPAEHVIRVSSVSNQAGEPGEGCG